MIRRIDDFLQEWEEQSAGTQLVLDALTDESLAQPVAPEGRTLGCIAWHIVTTLDEMLGKTGLAIDGSTEDAPLPAHAAEIAAQYHRGAQSVAMQIHANWCDASLDETIDMYGQPWTRARVLSVLLTHQTHHRGQLTVLMRQAGLRVPGVCGPAREDWAQFGMPAMP